jgi:hypothetical protein
VFIAVGLVEINRISELFPNHFDRSGQPQAEPAAVLNLN